MGVLKLGFQGLMLSLLMIVASPGGQANASSPGGAEAPESASGGRIVQVEDAPIRVSNGTGYTVHAWGEAGAEVVIPPGGEKEVAGVRSGTLTLETQKAQGAIPSRIEIAQVGPGVGVAAGTGRMEVQNTLDRRIDVHLDGAWTSALGPGAAFVQDMKPGTYSVGIYEGSEPRAIMERSLAVRAGVGICWTIGAEVKAGAGYLTVHNQGSVPLQISLNGGDRGRVLPGSQRTLVDVDGVAQPRPAGSAGIQAGPIWGGDAASGQAPSAPAQAPAAEAAAAGAAQPAAQPAPVTASTAAEAAPAPQATAERKQSGTIKVGNQTDRTLKVFLNGHEVGQLEPGKELVLADQPMGEHVVEAEDARAGAFVRARLQITRPGQTVVWNAMGW